MWLQNIHARSTAGSGWDAHYGLLSNYCVPGTLPTCLTHVISSKIYVTPGGKYHLHFTEEETEGQRLKRFGP